MPDTQVPDPSEFERLGVFYLGKRHDLSSRVTVDEPVLYDSRDLVTHAVCVGMTGSGKTGLCIGLIEEAAIDGVPVIAIDPKGDLGNLLLTFPGLSSDEFRPWVDEDEARRAGLSPEVFAARQAETWANGLRAWGQDGARIDRLRRSAEFSIYTPGSRAGKPVSMMTSFAAPPRAVREDAEMFGERASGTASSALVLAGVDVAPRDRAHTLLTMVLTEAWARGIDLDLPTLIRHVQTPPFDTVGVVDLESFFPARERFELAMQLNGVLAAPGFEAWMEGVPLDPRTLLYTDGGRPRVSVFSIAHLSDTERMFFVSLLLNEIVSWMRQQTGTSTLRAILYMDEIYGYFPPVSNPPSKGPLLTLLKQARAYGLGVVLATQNPADLDYKGLANTGTWFLGRLQTERDKHRVLEGLESAAGGLDRAGADRLLSGLTKRVFLMHNVHDASPTLFETRWTLSYLRGPLSRDQIRALAGTASAADHGDDPPRPATAAAHSTATRLPAPGPPTRTRGTGRRETAPSPTRPVIPPGIQELFLPGGADAGTAPFLYEPRTLGVVRVTFSDRRLAVSRTEERLYLAALSDGAIELDWTDAIRLPLTSDALRRMPPDEGSFAAVPAAALQPRKYSGWAKSLARWVSQHEALELLRDRASGLIAIPGEPEGDFRIRVQLATRTARDEAVDAIRKKYAAKRAVLAARVERAQHAVEREQQQASDGKLQAAVSVGATLLGALLGRKAVSTGTLGRATTAARGVGRTMKEASDVKRALETLESAKRAAAELEEAAAADITTVAARYDADARLERVTITPKRGQVEVQLVALAWVPSGLM